MMDNVELIPALVARLGKISRHNFENYDFISRLGDPNG